MEGLLEELEGITLDYILVRGREVRYLTFCFRGRVLVHLLHHPEDVRGLAVVLLLVLHEVDSVGRRASDRRAGGGWAGRRGRREREKGPGVRHAHKKNSKWNTTERENNDL